MVTRTTNKHSTNSRLVEHGKFLEVCPPDLLPRPNFKALLPAEKNLEVLLCLTPPWSPLLRSYIRAAAETGRWELWSPFMVEKLLPSPLPMQSDALYLASLVPSCLRRLPFSFPPAPYSNYHSFYSYALYSFRPCCTWPCVSVSKALSTQFPSLANCSEHWNKTLIVWYSRIKNLLHFIVSVPTTKKLAKRGGKLRSRMRLSFRNSEGKRKELKLNFLKSMHTHTHTHTNTRSLSLAHSLSSPKLTRSCCTLAHQITWKLDWSRELLPVFPHENELWSVQKRQRERNSGKTSAPAANGLTILKNNTKLEHQQQQTTTRHSGVHLVEVP